MFKLASTTLSLGCCLALALTACGDGKDTAVQAGKPAPGSAASAAEAPLDEVPAADEPAPAALAELSAPDFFKDYTSLQGLEVLDKYGKGVVVHGTVLRTIEELNGSLGVWLDAGDGNWVSLVFKDNGDAAKAKGVAKGATVKASCQVGGADTKYVLNIDCELQ